MSIFSIFSKAKKEKYQSLEAISDRLFQLRIEVPSKKRDMADIDNDINALYKKLSSLLFESVDVYDLENIKSILQLEFINKSKLTSDKGYNLIEYLLYNDKSEIFKTLYNDYFEDVKVYFSNIPVLFTIILKKKNFDLIELFLKDEYFYERLKKENIVDCFFNCLQNGDKYLLDYIINNFNDYLDSKNIEASMIYSISNNQDDELALLFSYENLIKKFSNKNLEKMVAFSILNQNTQALKLMSYDKHFMQALAKGDPLIVKNILEIANNKGEAEIINNFSNNLLFNENPDGNEILKIPVQKDKITNY